MYVPGSVNINFNNITEVVCALLIALITGGIEIDKNYLRESAILMAGSPRQ